MPPKRNQPRPPQLAKKAEAAEAKPPVQSLAQLREYHAKMVNHIATLDEQLQKLAEMKAVEKNPEQLKAIDKGIEASNTLKFHCQKRIDTVKTAIDQFTRASQMASGLMDLATAKAAANRAAAASKAIADGNQAVDALAKAGVGTKPAETKPDT